MKRILLLSRLFEESHASATRLRRRGWSVYRAPLLHLRPIVAPDLRAKLLRARAIALTSKSALRVFPSSKFSLAELRALRVSLRVYAVGEETAALARSKGFRDIRTACSSVSTLYELIEQSACKEQTIIHLSGKHIRGNLVAKLRENGYSAENIALYEAVSASSFPSSVERMFKQNLVYASIIYSARSADIFSRLYAQQVHAGMGQGKMGQDKMGQDKMGQDKIADKTSHFLPLRFFCLSQQIGERIARQFPSALIACAKEPSEKSLLQTIGNFRDNFGY